MRILQSRVSVKYLQRFFTNNHNFLVLLSSEEFRVQRFRLIQTAHHINDWFTYVVKLSFFLVTKIYNLLLSRTSYLEVYPFNWLCLIYHVTW